MHRIRDVAVWLGEKDFMRRKGYLSLELREVSIEFVRLLFEPVD
jgi:hypothetical protein